MPTIKGWVPSQAVVAEYKPSGTAHSTIIDVNYLPEARSQMIEYVDEDNQLIRSDAIVGRTGETVAVQSSVPTGWEIVAGKVPDTVVFDESADQPVRIVIKHRVITVDAEQAAKLNHADASELAETIVREIKVLMPHQDQPLITKQQVEFKRLGEYDLVDQKFVSFGDWQAVGSTLMAAYRVPEAAGYRPSVSGIGEQEATAGDADETIVINYVANQQTILVKYADEHGQVIASDPISGQTDQTVPITIKVPAGWKLIAGQVVPDNITFTATTPDIVLQVAHATVTVLPNDPKTTENLLPDNPDCHYPSGVAFADLNKTITRTIIFKLPDGHLKTIKQMVLFTRSAVVDEVTGQITYHDWQPLDDDKLASVTVPVLAGYTATMQVIPSLQVTAAMPDLTVEVEYVKSAAPDQPTTPDEPTPPDQPTHLTSQRRRISRQHRMSQRHRTNRQHLTSQHRRTSRQHRMSQRHRTNRQHRISQHHLTSQRRRISQRHLTSQRRRMSQRHLTSQRHWINRHYQINSRRRTISQTELEMLMPLKRFCQIRQPNQSRLKQNAYLRLAAMSKKEFMAGPLWEC